MIETKKHEHLSLAEGFKLSPARGRTLLSTMLLGLLLSLASACLGQNTFNNKGGDGTWENPKNWSTGKVPGDSDDVVIPAGQTVTTDGNKKCVHSLTNNGTIKGKDGTADSRDGGDVNLCGPVIINNGTIVGGNGFFDNGTGRGGHGGKVWLDSGGTILNGGGGTIQGGQGGTTGGNNPGPGGGVDVTGGSITNRGKIKGGDAGSSGQPGSNPAGGGDVQINGGTYDGKGGTIDGGAGWPGKPKNGGVRKYVKQEISCGDPGTSEAGSAVAMYVTGDSGAIDLSYLDPFAINASAAGILVCTAPGGTVDLRGNSPGTPVLMAATRIDIYADNVLLDPGVNIADLTQPAATVGPSLPSLAIVPSGGAVDISWSPLATNWLLQAADSLGPNAEWKSLLGVAAHYSEPAGNPARFFRLGWNLPTGQLYGSVTQSNGTPVPGATVQLLPNGASQTTDSSGGFSFFDVPLGLLDLEITTPVQVFDPWTHQVSVVSVSAVVPIKLATPQTAVILTPDIAVGVAAAPVCPCKPSTMACKAVVNGVLFDVTLEGTSIPNPCPGGNLTVTITDPNGKTVNPGPAGASYRPPANGVYTVTTTVCGVSSTSTVTVP